MNIDLEVFQFSNTIEYRYFDTIPSIAFGVDKVFNGKEFSGPTSNRLALIVKSFPSKEPWFPSTI